MYSPELLGRKARYEAYINSSEWRLLRAGKLELDPVCELCGTGSRIHVHHLKYAHLHDVELKQLMTLCETHHHWVHDLLRGGVIRRHHKASTLRRLVRRHFLKL
jgi:5-methylcytosine-specific restriction endonuclease McrA